MNIHFCGGEGINWALDHDLARTIRASEEHAKPVIAEKADLIHSVWWRAAGRLPLRIRKNKRVIGCIADDPKIVFGDPDVLEVVPYMTAWICEYRDSLEQMRSWGLPAFLVPSIVDTEVFHPVANRADVQMRFKREYSIPEDAYLIGNFHRDSSGEDVSLPKRQKGADVFFEIVRHLVQSGMPAHPVLAGPRRHWLRTQLDRAGIAYTFIGQIVEGDDREVNTLDHQKIRTLYHVLDLYLIASRWEGAPNAVLEAAATRTKVISSRVGQAPDILTRRQIFDDIRRAVELIEDDYENNTLEADGAIAFEHIYKNNTFERVAPLLRHLHAMTMRLPVNPGFYMRGLLDFRKKPVPVKRFETGASWANDGCDMQRALPFILPGLTDIADRNRQFADQHECQSDDAVFMCCTLEEAAATRKTLVDYLTANELSIIYLNDSDEWETSMEKPLCVWVGKEDKHLPQALRVLVRRGVPMAGDLGTVAHELAQLGFYVWDRETFDQDEIVKLRGLRESLSRLLWAQDNDEIVKLENTLEKRVKWQ